jgi:hypothetical protein
MALIVGVLAAILIALTTRGSAVAAGLAFGIAALGTYFTLPVFGLHFVGPWILICATLAVSGGTLLWLKAGQSGQFLEAKAATITAAAPPALLAGLAVFAFGSTASVFHANAYARLLGHVSTIPFAQAVQRLDTSGNALASDRTVIDQATVRLVDSEIAERRAQELLGSDPDLGGTYTLGRMELTKRRGRLVFAAPLEFTGLFRWWSSKGAPAYVWVDAHDPRQAELVREVDGQPVRLACTESAYFGNNLERVVWTSAPFLGATDYSFELGPNGRPYYVVTTYEHSVGFGGSTPTGIIVVDPQACTTERHGLADLPPWVNRVVPAEMAAEQAADWTSLGGGWLNASPFGAHAGIKTLTPGIELVTTTATGDTSWYIGLATSGNPNGTTGFLLIDSRNKNATYFQQSGATEISARNAMLGKIAEKRGWSVTLPILYNIGDRATYLAVLKDGSGNFKGVGLMPVDDRNLVVVADDLTRGLRAYTQALAGRSNGGADPAEPPVTIDGVVARVASEVVDGNTVYWLTFSNRPGLVVSATNRLGPQVALTRPGDALHVTAQGAAGGLLTVTALDNAAVLGTPTR